MSEEATINPDGTQDMPNMDGEIPMDEFPKDEGTTDTILKSVDPAVYLIVAAIVVVLFLIFYNRRQKKVSTDSFFSELDGDKVTIQSRVCVCVLNLINKHCLSSSLIFLS
jgi:hypothetical protein